MNEFENLIGTSAYLIWKSHQNKLDSQLGKTKLYKMLFMASWWAFETDRIHIYDGPWYRIDRGPALKTQDWIRLTDLMKDSYGVETSHITLGPGYTQFCFGLPKIYPNGVGESLFVEHLDRAFDAIIHLTSDEAAEITYETDPMRWIIAEERSAWGGSMQYRQFMLENDEREKFLSLAKEYVIGNIDIPEITRQMGQEWTNHRVSVYLDTFNIHRPPESAKLSERERERILNSLVQVIKGEREIIQDSVEERVMASGRIEEEYFAPDSIID